MKIKKFLAPLVAVSLMASAMPIASVSAANNEPKTYVDITYDNNGKIRADIIFENVPECWAGDFHVKVGEGWNLVYDQNNYIDISTENCTTEDIMVLTSLRSTNYFSVVFASKVDKDFNGRFCSFYLEKNSKFNSTNAKVNVVFENSGHYDDYLVNSNRDYIIGSANYKPPVMLEAQEYIIGDANNDGYVDAIDGSWLLSSIDYDPELKVENIIYNYTDIFPQANCAAAPDAKSLCS